MPADRASEQPAEGVVARQAIFKLEEFSEQPLRIAGKIGKVHATLGAADRRHQGNRHHLKQILPRGVAASRIRQVSKATFKPTHPSTPTQEADTRIHSPASAKDLNQSNAIPVGRVQPRYSGRG